MTTLSIAGSVLLSELGQVPPLDTPRTQGRLGDGRVEGLAPRAVFAPAGPEALRALGRIHHRITNSKTPSGLPSKSGPTASRHHRG